MKRSPWHLVGALLLAVLLAGCAAQPDLDTVNKRVYATELAVEGMLAQVDQYQQEGRFTDAEWAAVQDQLRRLREAYRAMEIAQSMGEDPGMNIATIHNILMVLRQYMVGDAS